ncbi:MAG: depupylase/deamidase Dop [Myxococcales bacterium]|nr:proteasome accessory factor PafA2 [Myxococcales bacterium]HIK85628.1 proteasome accessory factor PafA2 [Myxococcales bacterium]
MAIPTVMGTEIEFGIMVKNDPDFDPISSCVLIVNAYREEPDGKILWDYDQENPLADARGFQVEGEKYTPNQQENIARNKTLINGARYYVDHAHPEYSCPEVTNARDLVIHEKAGERVIEISRREANNLLPDGAQMLIYKNNSDRKGNSYGCHENYLMDRRTSFKKIVEPLLPFFSTRQIWCGAGKVGSESRNHPCDYQISQRADFFETEVALDTMVKRPIVNTRDEPHADREKYRRLHVIVGDSNMSEYTIYLRNGVTALILSMIEDGAISKDLTLRDPVRTIRAVSHDLSLAHELTMDDGSARTALEIQSDFLEMALAYTSSRSLDPVQKDVLQKWQEVIEALGRDPMELDTKIDWIIKKRLIERYMGRKNLAWDDSQVQMLDLQYHDSRPDKGLYHVLERQGKVERIVTDDEIQHALYNPPRDTRAFFRGECLRRYSTEVFGVNWDSISFGFEDDSVKRIMMAEPLKGTSEFVEELLERSETAAELLENMGT